jgi:hypothetical protein
VVLPELPDVASHAGFLTVNKLFNSNMFFWYFPAAFKPETAPLLIWLQAVLPTPCKIFLPASLTYRPLGRPFRSDACLRHMPNGMDPDPNVFG